MERTVCNNPLIRFLDTDDKDKAARCAHLGMKLDRVRGCGEKFHIIHMPNNADVFGFQTDCFFSI